jgi:hypothetical protein
MRAPSELRSSFNRRGYAIARSCLPAEVVVALRAECDTLLKRQRRAGTTLASTGCVLDIFAAGLPRPAASARTDANAYFHARSAALGRATDASVRNAIEATLPRIVSALLGAGPALRALVPPAKRQRRARAHGATVRLFNEHCVVKPSAADVGESEALCEFRWHVDAAEQLQLLPPARAAAHDYVSCWCALDDCDAANGSLSFHDVPSSGAAGATAGAGEGAGAPAPPGPTDKGALVCASAGDVVFFSCRKWHRSGANETDAARRVFYAQYSRGALNVGGTPLAFAVRTLPPPRT